MNDEPPWMNDAPPPGDVLPPVHQGPVAQVPRDSLSVFEQRAGVPSASQATQIEQARAVAEVRAAVLIAMEHRRDVPAAIMRMRESCQIPALAERAFFRVQRGREQVNGASIHLARELARCWGNIKFDVAELRRDDVLRQSEMQAWAWDLESNVQSTLRFTIPHERHTRSGPMQLRGTQEIYENNASFAGRRLREVIFNVLPPWFRAEAEELCHATLADGGGVPLVQRIANLITGFEGIGVTRAQLEAKIGRKADDFLAEDVANLGVVFKSIKRGEVTRDDEFPPLAGQAALPANATSFERAAAGGAKGSQEPAKADKAPVSADPSQPATETATPAQAPRDTPPPSNPAAYRIVRPGKSDQRAPSGQAWTKWWHEQTHALRAENKGISLKALVDANQEAWAETEALGGDYAEDVKDVRGATAAALKAMGVS